VTSRRTRAATLADRSGQPGQGLVEFALVIPVAILLMVAFADLGIGVFSYNSVTNASREGARLAIVNQDVASIRQRAVAATAIAETATPNVTVEFRRATPNEDPRTNALCGAPVPVGCIAVVTYQTTYRPLTPIIGKIVFSGGVTLTATTMLPVEYTCPSATIALPTGCPKQP